MQAFNYDNTYLLWYASGEPVANAEEQLAIQKYISDGVFNGYTAYSSRDIAGKTDPSNPVFEHGIFNLNAGTFVPLMLRFNTNGDFTDLRISDLWRTFWSKVEQFNDILGAEGISDQQRNFTFQLILQKFFVLFENKFSSQIEQIKQHLIAGQRWTYVWPGNQNQEWYETDFILALQAWSRGINPLVVGVMKQYAQLFEKYLPRDRQTRMRVVNNTMS